MLRRHRFSALVAAFVLSLASVTAIGVSAAHADTGSGTVCIGGGDGNSQCTGSGTSPTGSGDGGTSSGGICMDDTQSVDYNGTSYPCSEPGGPIRSWWYVGGGCYSTKIDPADYPAAGDPAWGGHSSTDNGFIVERDCNKPPSMTDPGAYKTWERCIAICVAFNQIGRAHV
jgi:hypothetical protein